MKIEPYTGLVDYQYKYIPGTTGDLVELLDKTSGNQQITTIGQRYLLIRESDDKLFPWILFSMNAPEQPYGYDWVEVAIRTENHLFIEENEIWDTLLSSFQNTKPEDESSV